MAPQRGTLLRGPIVQAFPELCREIGDLRQSLKRATSAQRDEVNEEGKTPAEVITDKLQILQSLFRESQAGTTRAVVAHSSAAANAVQMAQAALGTAASELAQSTAALAQQQQDHVCFSGN